MTRSQLLLRRSDTINAIIEKVKPTVENVLSALGYELVDIEYKSMYGEMHLVVYIACDHDISLDDCERASNALDDPLDALDPTESKPYCLDVSSPGLDRPFKTQRDYERNYGKKVEVKLFAPLPGTKTKLFVGTLLNRTDGDVTIEADGKTTVIENSRVAVVRPYVEF